MSIIPSHSPLVDQFNVTSPQTSLGQSIFPGRLGVSIEEFASACDISRTSAYLAAQRGEIPTKRIGRRLIVPIAAVDAWLSK